MGAEFPELLKLDVNLELQYETLVIDPFPDLTVEVADERDDLYFEKEYAVDTIKLFTKCKDEDKIREYVNSKIKRFEDRDGFFILNREVSLIDLIEE